MSRRSYDDAIRKGSSSLYTSHSLFLLSILVPAAGCTTHNTAQAKIPLLHLKRSSAETCWECSSNLASVYLSTSLMRSQHPAQMTDGPPYWRWQRFNRHQWVSYPGAHIVTATSRYSCNNTVEYPQHISQNARGSRARIRSHRRSFQRGSKSTMSSPLPPSPKTDTRLTVSMTCQTLPIMSCYSARSCRESESQLRHTPDTQVVLPLSPNHRLFANDGLCSESKISLDALRAMEPLFIYLL